MKGLMKRRCVACGIWFKTTSRTAIRCAICVRPFDECDVFVPPARPGCKTCWINRGECDDHQVPAVCICDQPKTNRLGECQTCLRPYKPEVPGFDACREAWQRQMEGAQA